MIDLNDLRHFVTIVECGGLAGAAKRSGIHRSTLSRRLAVLEDDLGVSLAERGPRHFRITATGRAFYEHCRRVVDDAEAAGRSIRARGASEAETESERLPEAGARANQQILPASAQRRPDAVQAFIMQGIQRKAFVSGDQLPSERDLAASLGVARPAVREAIRSLEMSGVLRLERGSGGGTFIRDIGADGLTYALKNMLILGHSPVSHLLEVRLSIIGQAVQLAAERGSEEEFLLMEESVRQLDTSVRSGEPLATVKPAGDFYRLVARASRNPVLELLVDAIARIVAEMLADIRQWPLIDGVTPRRAVLAALRERDPATAAAILRHHIEESNRILMRYGESSYALSR